MTNLEILHAPKNLLGSLEKQIRFIMEMELVRKPCPSCGELHNMPEAAGVTIDQFDFAHSNDRVGPCRKCKRTLIFRLPWPTGDWYWALDPDEFQN